MIEIPADPTVNWIGSLLIVFGLFLFISGIGIMKIENITVSKGWLTTLLGIVLIAAGALLIGFNLPGEAEPAEPTLTPTVTVSVVPAITSIPPTNTADTFVQASPTLTPESITAEAQIEYPEDNTVVGRTVYVKGYISGLKPDQRAFLCVQSELYGRIFPQGEVIADPAGNWLVESVFETVGARYILFVVATNDANSAEVLGNEHFRMVGLTSLPDNAYTISEKIILERR
jgi:hypothetical protein